jgi:hypothetical protein
MKERTGKASKYLYLARQRSTASNTRSGVAGRSSAVILVASHSAFHTAVASISGGSPTPFDRKIVAARAGALASKRSLKSGGASRLPGIL